MSACVTGDCCYTRDKTQRRGETRLTVQDDPHQRLVALVQDLPQGEGLLWSVGQQPEQQGDGVVGGQAFRVDVSVSQSRPGSILRSLLGYDLYLVVDTANSELQIPEIPSPSSSE